MKYLTFKTSGNWTTDEWLALLYSITSIYNIFLAKKIVIDFRKNIPKKLHRSTAGLSMKEILLNFHNCVNEDAKLKLFRVKMASPGEVIFSGIDKSITQVNNLLISLFTIPEIKKGKQLDNEIKKQQIKKMAIENQILQSTSEINAQRLLSTSKNDEILQVLQIRHCLKNTGLTSKEIKDNQKEFSSFHNCIKYLREKSKISF